MAKVIGVIGLGYVGLPLAVAFSEQYKVIGFDINKDRISNLASGIDTTLELSASELFSVLHHTSNNIGLTLTNTKNDLEECDYFIVTVPTPTDAHNNLVLAPIIKASETVGQVMRKACTVIYESTVYPGLTEEICVPILEEKSGLRLNQDFYVGYSPERINPGDQQRKFKNILKITSGSTPEAAKEIDRLYASVIEAGTYLAPSIKVAEAAKVIENSQRDINIAFVNELSKIFRILDIDTDAVLDAAATKWNFVKYSPGLVGGHCIGVDPYYLAQKAIQVGYHPEIILAGRRMNDGMGKYVAQEIIKLMIKKDAKIKGGRALVLGITFKENCPDIRNTRTIDVIENLKEYQLAVDVCDPWANPAEVQKYFNLSLITDFKNLNSYYDVIVLAVAHHQFLDLDISSYKKEPTVVFDVKSFLPKDQVDGSL